MKRVEGGFFWMEKNHHFIIFFRPSRYVRNIENPIYFVLNGCLYDGWYSFHLIFISYVLPAYPPSPQMPKMFRQGTRKSSRLARREQQEEYDPADVCTRPSSPVAEDKPFWLERSYNFNTKEESARLMPKGFEPPADNENGRYVSGEDYAQQLLDEIMKENDEKDDKMLRESADIVLKGERWDFVDDENMLFNVDTLHTVHNIYAEDWMVVAKNGYTYLKKGSKDVLDDKN